MSSSLTSITPPSTTLLAEIAAPKPSPAMFVVVPPAVYPVPAFKNSSTKILFPSVNTLSTTASEYWLFTFASIGISVSSTPSATDPNAP